MEHKKFEEEKLEDDDFNFIGWFGEDTDELEDYEEGNNEKVSQNEPDDDDWAYKYDYD